MSNVFYDLKPSPKAFLQADRATNTFYFGTFFYILSIKYNVTPRVKCFGWLPPFGTIPEQQLKVKYYPHLITTQLSGIGPNEELGPCLVLAKIQGD